MTLRAAATAVSGTIPSRATSTTPPPDRRWGRAPPLATRVSRWRSGDTATNPAVPSGTVIGVAGGGGAGGADGAGAAGAPLQPPSDVEQRRGIDGVAAAGVDLEVQVVVALVRAGVAGRAQDLADGDRAPDHEPRRDGLEVVVAGLGAARMHELDAVAGAARRAVVEPDLLHDPGRTAYTSCPPSTPQAGPGARAAMSSPSWVRVGER